MAIVKDLSGNSPIGDATDDHIPRPHEVSALRITAAANATADTTPVTIGPFNARTRYVRLSPLTGDIYYLVGSNPTAAATSAQLPSEAVEYIKVRPGDKISLYAAAAVVVSYAEGY